MGEALEVCELGDLAGERVEQADSVVPVTLQEEQAVGGVEDAVVLELREGGHGRWACRRRGRRSRRGRRARGGLRTGRSPPGRASNDAGGSEGPARRGRAGRRRWRRRASGSRPQQDEVVGAFVRACGWRIRSRLWRAEK